MEIILVKPKNKKATAFLKHLLSNLSDVKSVEVVDFESSQIAKNIDKGLKDVKLIISGKKKAKTLNQLLSED